MRHPAGTLLTDPADSHGDRRAGVWCVDGSERLQVGTRWDYRVGVGGMEDCCQV